MHYVESRIPILHTGKVSSRRGVAQKFRKDRVLKGEDMHDAMPRYQPTDLLHRCCSTLSPVWISETWTTTLLYIVTCLSAGQHGT